MDRLDKEALFKNEVDANKAMAKGSIFIAIFLAILFILYVTGVFYVNRKTMINVYVAFPIFIAVLGSAYFYTKTKLIEKPGFKYFLITQLVLVIFVLNVLLPKHTMIGWALVIVIVSHYYNPKASLIAFISIAVLMIVALYAGMLYGEWDANLLSASTSIDVDGTVVLVDEATYEQRVRWLAILRENGDNRYLKVFLYYYLPRLATVTLVYFTCYGLSQRSLKILREAENQAKINQKMQGELEMARNIQASVLPMTFPKNEKGEVFALMEPAKEVGGDFYDFFYIDETHMAFVIADVSGKGIPGALFMMKTETLIKSLATSLKTDTASILEHANTALCSNNEANMFVTCWLGILNLTNGELRYSNAGHNLPVIFKDQKAEFLKGKRSLVLGAMNNVKYKENVINLNEGDSIILYTDGVTEAHNLKHELFGEERLIEFANKNYDHNSQSFISKLKEEINEFSAGQEQFDDITMLMFEYRKGAAITQSRIFKADVKELDNLYEYSSSLLTFLNFPRRDIIMINTALEEVFVNVAHYAYDEEGTVEISLSNDMNNVFFVFKDHGKPFNPLEKEDPNITAKSDEREVGGLGIFMVKNIMDEVNYKYEDGYNVLTLIKKRA